MLKDLGERAGYLGKAKDERNIQRSARAFSPAWDGMSDESGAGRTEPNAMSLAGCRPSVRAGAASSMESWRRERKEEDWLGCEGGEDGGKGEAWRACTYGRHLDEKTLCYLSRASMHTATRAALRD